MGTWLRLLLVVIFSAQNTRLTVRNRLGRWRRWVMSLRQIVCMSICTIKLPISDFFLLFICRKALSYVIGLLWAHLHRSGCLMPLWLNLLDWLSVVWSRPRLNQSTWLCLLHWVVDLLAPAHMCWTGIHWLLILMVICSLLLIKVLPILLHLPLMVWIRLSRVWLSRRNRYSIRPNLRRYLVVLEELLSYIERIYLATCKNVTVWVNDQVIWKVWRHELKRQLFNFQPVFLVDKPLLLRKGQLLWLSYQRRHVVQVGNRWQAFEKL